MFKPFTPLVLAALAALPIPASAFETRAGSAYVVDFKTGTVLMDKNAEVPLPPASMSKLMTLNMLFEALRDGRVTMDTTFAVSSKARAMGGSTMFLNERDRPTVEQLVKGIIVLSGNDACVVVAEGLAGSEEAFARQMTERGRAIGLEASHFSNASGWPDPEQRMTMKDLTTLGVHLIREFPEYYHYFAITEFPFDNRAPANRHNRNPILSLGIGADGLKTGHTQESGYGLVGSAQQGERRVVFTLNGMATEAERREESESVVNWAFRNFVEKTVVRKGEVIVEADVWMGSTSTVGLTVTEDLQLLVPALVQGQVSAEAIYAAPLKAPLAAGQQVGELVIRMPDMEPRHVPLVTATAVAEGGFGTRLLTAARVLVHRMTGAESAPAGGAEF
ncbi:D-alanyl-D-alanine carboxypeptidase family protein [Haematobacter sp.]|uniref:D-alanyl-D-alanine carboxypeptidase family protein n=1 Tax=Haematobacter sp. TaxID=2953762 RepID=UPI0028AD8FCF|nr:D-alanyl-D-alanine carboxypeptidase family protein [Haematobacter sp.]